MGAFRLEVVFQVSDIVLKIIESLQNTFVPRDGRYFSSYYKTHKNKLNKHILQTLGLQATFLKQNMCGCYGKVSNM